MRPSRPRKCNNAKEHTRSHFVPNLKPRDPLEMTLKLSAASSIANQSVEVVANNAILIGPGGTFNFNGSDLNEAKQEVTDKEEDLLPSVEGSVDRLGEEEEEVGMHVGHESKTQLSKEPEEPDGVAESHFDESDKMKECEQQDGLSNNDDTEESEREKEEGEEEEEDEGEEGGVDEDLAEYSIDIKDNIVDYAEALNKRDSLEEACRETINDLKPTSPAMPAQNEQGDDVSKPPGEPSFQWRSSKVNVSVTSACHEEHDPLLIPDQSSGPSALLGATNESLLKGFVSEAGKSAPPVTLPNQAGLPALGSEYMSLERLGEGGSKSDVCGERANDLEGLNEHRARAGHFKCGQPDCRNQIFMSSEDLTAHTRVVHPPQFPRPRSSRCPPRAINQSLQSPPVKQLAQQVQRLLMPKPYLNPHTPMVQLDQMKSFPQDPARDPPPLYWVPAPTSMAPPLPFTLKVPITQEAMLQMINQQYRHPQTGFMQQMESSQQQVQQQQQQPRPSFMQGPRGPQQQQQLQPRPSFMQGPRGPQQQQQLQPRPSFMQGPRGPQQQQQLQPRPSFMQGPRGPQQQQQQQPRPSFMQGPRGPQQQQRQRMASPQQRQQKQQLQPRPSFMQGPRGPQQQQQQQPRPSFMQGPRGPQQQQQQRMASPQQRQQKQQLQPRPSFMQGPRGPQQQQQQRMASPQQRQQKQQLQPRPSFMQGPRGPQQQQQQRMASPQQRQQKQQLPQIRAKRMATVPPLGTSPNAKRRMEMLKPDRRDNADCHVMAMQERTDTGPVINSVEGSTNHPTDSITTSVVRRPGWAVTASPIGPILNQSNAKAVAKDLVSRGITMAPASGGHNNVPATNQRQTPPRPVQVPAVPTGVITLNLNSAISIIPTGNQNSGFAVPQNRAVNRKQNQTNVGERPPPLPTVGLTMDSHSRQMHGNHMRGRPSGSRDGGTQNQCQVCDKAFSTEESLAQHMQLPYRCSAQYPTQQVLLQNSRVYPEPARGSGELAIPIVNLKHTGTLSLLAGMGIHHYLPMSQISSQQDGCFGLPIVTMDAARNPAVCNLRALGATDVLSMGPMKPLPR